MIEGFHNLIPGGDISGLIEEILEKSGYRKALSEQKTVEAVTRLENLEELQKVARDFDDRNISLEDFLSLTSLTSDLDMMEDVNEMVTLMTVHSAKGLEFPVAFLTGMEENIFPHQRAISTGKTADIEEERRLAYVAMTRAMNKLYLSYAWRRISYGGGSTYNEKSRFLEEVSSCIDKPSKDKDLFGSSSGKSKKKSSPVPSKKTKSVNKSSRQTFFRRGDNVKHGDFGRGVVLEVMGSGLAYQLKVSFPRVGLRKVDVSDVEKA